VTLSVLRGTGPPISVRITRDIVQTQEVDSKVLAGGTVGYLKLSGFSMRGADQVVTALRAFRSRIA
jgi:C-terminal processing protease CtpA/Prc